MDFCHYISVAAHYGFEFHHTKPKYLMMYLWLPEDVPNKVPPFGTHHLGVAGKGVLLYNLFFSFVKNEICSRHSMKNSPGGSQKHVGGVGGAAFPIG